MKRCRLLILTAVYPEAQALARAFHFEGKKFDDGLLEGDISLGVIGIGGKRLPEILARVLPQAIIITGLAGGLAPGLKVGDIVVEGACQAIATAGFSIHEGMIHTSKIVVAKPTEKQSIYLRTRALAVDMETQVVREVARARRIPFGALRVISDAAHEPIDPTLLSLIDDQGKPSLGRVAKLLMRNPAQLSALLHMKRAADTALTHLGAVLVQCAASGWPDNRHSVAPAAPATPPSEKM